MVRWSHLKSSPRCAYCSKHVLCRLPCVHVNNLLGGAAEDTGVQGSGYFENHCRRCNTILPGHIHLPLRAHDDPKSWTGMYNRPTWTTTNDIRLLSPAVAPASSSSVSCRISEYLTDLIPFRYCNQWQCCVSHVFRLSSRSTDRRFVSGTFP